MSRAWQGGSTRAWRELRAYVLERDGYRCRVPNAAGQPCGAYARHADHVVPRSRGGQDHPANLRAACATCNLRRGNATPRSVSPDPVAPARVRAWSW